MDHQGWHILLTEPRRERHAATQLTARGIKVYLPEMPPRRKHYFGRRKPVNVIEPMFPRYLFTPAQNVDWGLIRRCSGIVVSHPTLMLNDRPAIVPHAALEAIQAKEQEIIADAKARKDQKFKRGQMVQVSDESNPFFGLMGKIERMQGSDRVRVLLALFKGRTAATMRADQLRSASEMALVG